MKKEYKKIRLILQNASPHLCLIDIPGFISGEAPSSRLNSPGYNASHHICTIKPHAYEQ